MKSRVLTYLMGVLISLTSGCTTPNTEPTAGSESHFLTACDDTCLSGLACLCGTCTQSCATSTECERLNPAAVCVAPLQSDAGPTCEQTQTTPHCDVPCVGPSDCSAFGTDFFCSRGYCRLDPLSRPNEPLPGYGLLCNQSTVSCATTESPPTLGSPFAGQATVVLSSNALWAVGGVNAFTAVISDQTSNLLTATVTLPSFTINIQGAAIRGAGSAFTVYDSSLVDQDGCNLEVRSVLSGILDAAANPPTVTGGLALRFTGNYAGSACTSTQIDTYPATGANFTVAATRGP